MTQLKISFPFPLAIITATKDEFLAIYNKFIMNIYNKNDPLYSGKINEHLLYSKPFACFKIKDTIFCVLSGFGKINAASATQWAIDILNVKSVLNFGAAAGISMNADVGDIYVAHTLYDHQHKNEADQITLTSQSKQIYKHLIQHFPEIKKGVITSGDEDIDSEQKRQYLSNQYKADCADWESYAITKTANENQIPCLIIRVISDLGNEDFYNDYKNNLPSILEKGADLLYRVL